MSYQPQPGTIPHRAISFLQKQDAGTELAAAVICEDLGIDTNSFSVCMKPAREAGLVRTRKEGRLLIWSLGDGTPDLPPRDEEEVDPALPPRRQKAEQAEPVEQPFNAALWADGELVLYGVQENEDGSFTLTAQQVATIKRMIAWCPA